MKPETELPKQKTRGRAQPVVNTYGDRGHPYGSTKPPICREINRSWGYHGSPPQRFPPGFRLYCIFFFFNIREKGFMKANWCKLHALFGVCCWIQENLKSWPMWYGALSGLSCWPQCWWVGLCFSLSRSSIKCSPMWSCCSNHTFILFLFLDLQSRHFFQDGFQHISAQNHGSWRMTSLFPLLAYIILFTYVYIYIYLFTYIF